MKAAKISLLEVVAGIWLIAVVVILAGVFFVPNPLAYVLGEIAGSATSSLMMVHLYRSLDVELDLPESRAVNHARFTSVLRSLIEIGVLAGSFFIPDWVLPYTVLAGLLARKFAAMLVPLMERIRQRGGKGGPVARTSAPAGSDKKNEDGNQTDFSAG